MTRDSIDCDCSELSSLREENYFLKKETAQLKDIINELQGTKYPTEVGLDPMMVDDKTFDQFYDLNKN